MKNQIIAIAVALSIFAAMAITCPHERCTCAHNRQVIVQTMTTSITALTVHDHNPNNHNWQEHAISSEKTYKIENPADYMEGLTSISKRSIYVGEADGSASQKLNL